MSMSKCIDNFFIHFILVSIIFSLGLMRSCAAGHSELMKGVSLAIPEAVALLQASSEESVTFDPGYGWLHLRHNPLDDIQKIKTKGYFVRRCYDSYEYDKEAWMAGFWNVLSQKHNHSLGNAIPVLVPNVKRFNGTQSGYHFCNAIVRAVEQKKIIALDVVNEVKLLRFFPYVSRQVQFFLYMLGIKNVESYIKYKRISDSTISVEVNDACCEKNDDFSEKIFLAKSPEEYVSWNDKFTTVNYSENVCLEIADIINRCSSKPLVREARSYLIIVSQHDWLINNSQAGTNFLTQLSNLAEAYNTNFVLLSQGIDSAEQPEKVVATMQSKPAGNKQASGYFPVNGCPPLTVPSQPHPVQGQRQKRASAVFGSMAQAVYVLGDSGSYHAGLLAVAPANGICYSSQGGDTHHKQHNSQHIFNASGSMSGHHQMPVTTVIQPAPAAVSQTVSPCSFVVHDCYGSKHHVNSDNYVQLMSTLGSVSFYDAAYDPATHYLSNTYQCNFYLDDEYWSSVEAYFQCKKLEYTSLPPHARTQAKAAIRGATGGGSAKKIARQLVPASSVNFGAWNGNKYGVMYQAVHAKFSQNAFLKTKLLGTYPKIIIEDTAHASGNDADWGSGQNYNGHNNAGMILGAVRYRIYNDSRRR